jgi:alpha-L-rhamnosidase
MLIGLPGLFVLASSPVRAGSVPVVYLNLKMKTPRTVKSADMRPLALRCEYLPNPLGIETLHPRLYWTLDSKRRGEMQSAYQILVASSPEALKADRGDLWDSGKVASEQSTHIVYEGQPLRSGERAWWKVRVWDRDGRVSGYAAPVFWEMGLLAAQDWRAHWIGMPDAPSEKTADIWKDAQWVWYPEGDPLQSAPAADRYFWRSIQLPQKPVRKAELVGIADNSFAVSINGKEVGGGSDWHRPTTLDLTSRLSPGANLLTIKANNTDGPAGLACVVRIIFADGTEQRVVTDGQWHAQTPEERSASPAGSARTDTAPSGGTMARSLGLIGIAPWGRPGAQAPARPAPYLRKAFALNKPVKSARVYATAQGLYRLYVNGTPVSKDVFRPGWTDYNKRMQYQTYDVTRLMQNGPNALGVVLGDGWFCGHVGLTGGNNYGTKPRALVQMQVTYEDGTNETIVSDDSWKAASGPVLSDDLLDGETYDARKELTGWNTAGFNAGAWSAVEEKLASSAAAPSPQSPQSFQSPQSSSPLLVSQPDQSVQVVEELKPHTITEKPNGAYVFDLGQNMVGWARLKVRAEAGTTVRLRFAEMLNPDGTIYTTNLRGAKCTDYYTCRGGGTETWEPAFTFHGFRYVELTGLKSRPGMDAVTGVVITSAAPTTGTFACSSPLVNQLQHNILWGQHGNYLEVPTDCPQRDERLGWMGDAQIFVRTACFNNDIAAFMTKWTQDVVDAQSPEGGFSDVTPRMGDKADGAPAWGDAGVIVPWTIYQCYGDTRLIAERYPAMQKWIEYIHSVNPDLIWRKRANNNFGDWLNTGSDTPREVLSTAYFAYSTRLLGKMALAIGKEDEARQYEDLFQQIKGAFNQEFVAADGRIKGDTQTAYVLALRFDLLPQEKRESAAKYLVDDIQNKRNGHLSTGFLGVGYLTPTLTQAGYLDVAYRLLNNDTYPSWGYSIRHGATTIWERWDGWTEEKGFQDPGMNSFNHYSLGSVGEWMYASVAGIDLDPAQPGYKHILLHPHPGGGLTYARAAYDSIHGHIVSDWKIENGRLAYHVEVPANTTATVWVPATGETQVMEGGKSAAKAEGIKFLRMEAGCAVYEIGSGTYAFTAPVS